ncbi:MAG TPA: M1 family aminopeptidase [Flavobacteriaceae bacterium]
MKAPLLFFVFLISLLTYAQDFNETLNSIREAEAKSASKKMMHSANLNTGNYDVTYHRLEFTVDPSSTILNGVVTTHFMAKENMTEVTFDLSDNMIVSQVMQNGNALSFTQNSNDELVITLFETLNLGETGIVEITYSGNPISSGFGSYEQDTHDGDPIIWTLSEPYGAKGWWPCKQDLNDKIDSIDVYITTPQYNLSNEEYVAVSNGLEQSQTINGSNKTTHFKHQYPIPAYLVAMAVTNYEVYSHTVPNNGNPFVIVNYVYPDPENLESAQSSTPVTVDIMNLYSSLFEEYPFADEKYGHAQFGWNGGMEHTTVSFMGSFGRNLIAHELAHQWFGNKITCGSWKDIWLNEGFATYLSGLTIENLGQNSDFIIWKQQRINSITSQPNGAVYLTDADTTDVGRIFDGRLSYNKGAMVLHMLRKKLGDVDFFQGLQNYLADANHAYAYAKTEDLIAIMETTTGQDLSEFFNDWLYNQGYPSYTLQWYQAGNQLYTTVSQTQSDPSVSFFEAPLPIKVNGTLGEELDIILDNTTNNEAFSNTVNFTISSIEFDPEADIISKDNSITLGIRQSEFPKGLLVFPNPTSNTITIQKPDHLEVNEIRIFNAIGQLLYKRNWTPKIDLTSFSTGLLFVQFQTNEGVINKSVLKK